MSRSQFSEYKDTALWSAVADAMAELVATGEVAVNTASDYVIWHLCRELAAKQVVSAPALRHQWPR
ncbi:MAG TPA: hypothetical protein VGQ44_11365 [Gemmatimonadaceae bacterium]|jgi:hypothetical protein|nr:hypothetical protein [Gemmatimonadaceae bacterium]